MKRVKQTKAQTQALSQSVVTNMSANVNNFNGNQSQPGNNQYAGRGSNTGKQFVPKDTDMHYYNYTINVSISRIIYARNP